MDLSQLIIIAVAVAGAVLVGLLAIVPTVLELPRGADSTDPPTPFTRGTDPGDHRGHKLAA